MPCLLLFIPWLLSCPKRLWLGAFQTLGNLTRSLHSICVLVNLQRFTFTKAALTLLSSSRWLLIQFFIMIYTNLFVYQVYRPEALKIFHEKIIETWHCACHLPLCIKEIYKLLLFVLSIYFLYFLYSHFIFFDKSPTKKSSGMRISPVPFHTSGRCEVSSSPVILSSLRAPLIPSLSVGSTDSFASFAVFLVPRVFEGIFISSLLVVPQASFFVCLFHLICHNLRCFLFSSFVHVF